jgi:hypothetical protein
MNEGIELGTTDVMASMRHRILVLGGSLSVVHTAGASTVLTASIPLPARALLSERRDRRHVAKG